MIVVPDAGPLIYLAGSGHLGLLRELYAEAVVPRVVYDEVTVTGRGMVGADEVRAATWLRVEENAPDPSLLDVLDKGEASAIPLAERLGAHLLIDDWERVKSRALGDSESSVRWASCSLRNVGGCSLRYIPSSNEWRGSGCTCPQRSVTRFFGSRASSVVGMGASHFRRRGAWKSSRIR